MSNLLEDILTKQSRDAETFKRLLEEANAADRIVTDGGEPRVVLTMDQIKLLIRLKSEIELIGRQDLYTIQPVKEPLPHEDEWKPLVDELMAKAPPEPEPWLHLDERQRAFLVKYSYVKSVTQAAKDVCHPINHLRWLRESDEYREAFEDVEDLIADDVEARAHHIALHGEVVPSMLKGRKVTDGGTPILIRRYDNRVLTFLIRRNDRRAEVHSRQRRAKGMDDRTVLAA